MKKLDEMYSFSSKLWYDKRWINKSGEASLYLQVTINGKHKEFPLKLKWPVRCVDLTQSLLLPRFKNDPEVNAANIIIERARAKHHDINWKFKVIEHPLDMIRFCKEIVVFNDKDCFLTYMETEAKRRFNRNEIDLKTFQNANATRKLLAKYDKYCLFKDINLKWMKRLKVFLSSVTYKSGKEHKHYKPGTIWARIKEIKTYLQLASVEPLLFVRPEAVSFPNPKPTTETTFLDDEEVRRLMIVSKNGGLTSVQENVLKAFLFTCFTSLRISDVYRANSKWEHANGILRFIPKKGERKAKYHSIQLMPMANAFISKIDGKYFELPSEQEYNRTLKELALMAYINKHLTSHVGRHTFGYLYMTTTGNIYGLQQVMGHSKLETTERYAHLDDDYQKQAVKGIQDKFSDLIIRRIK